MPIPVTCSCGKKLNAPDTLAGKRVKCPGCQALVLIPEPLEVIEDEVEVIREVPHKVAATKTPSVPAQLANRATPSTARIAAPRRQTLVPTDSVPPVTAPARAAVAAKGGRAIAL